MKQTSSPSDFRKIPNPDDIDLIILDLGGVILNIDYRLTQEALANIGMSNVHEAYSQKAQNELFDNLETGTYSPDEFREGIRKLGNSPATDEAIDQAWNALIQDLPPHRLDCIGQLRHDYKVCMLSNTNEIHIKAFEAMIGETIGVARYQSSFDQIFYSSRIRERKPDAAAFEYVLQQMGVSAERSFFVDDSSQHLVTSSSLGIHSYHLQVGKEDICEVLSPFRNRLA